MDTHPYSVESNDNHDLCRRVVDILAGPEGNREVSLLFSILPPCGAIAGVPMAGHSFDVPA